MEVLSFSDIETSLVLGPPGHADNPVPASLKINAPIEALAAFLI
jgi:hypothetical protein